MIRALRRRLDVARRAEHGMSLIELVVAMGLLSIVLTVVVVFFSSVTRSFTREQSATENSNQSALAMREISRVVRAGTTVPLNGANAVSPMIVTATSDTLTLYSFLDADDDAHGTTITPSPGTTITALAPFKITLKLSGGRLVEERESMRLRTDNTYEVIANTKTTRTLANNLQTPVRLNATDTATVPLFVYENLAGASIGDANGSLSPTSNAYKTLASIQVTIGAQTDTTGRNAVATMQNTVYISNLEAQLTDLQNGS